MPEIRLKADNVHEVTVNGARVLFHVPTTSVFELDALGCEVMDLLRDGRPVQEADLYGRFDGRYPGSDIAELLADLSSLDLLAREGEQPARRRPPLPEDALSTLVLSVTNGCNLSCTYCYKEDLTRPAQAHRLTPEKARQAVDFLFRQAGRRERLNITFFGGEPLLNQPLIRETVAYAEAQAGQAGKRVDFSMTTNGTLLDDETAAYLDAHHFGLTVSMDGPKDMHDRNRRTIGDKGSYDVVAPKVRRLLDSYRSRPVGARVTLAAGVTDVLGIHRHLKDELGFAEVGFAPVTAGLPEGFGLSDEESRAIFDALKTLGERYRDAALAGRDIGFTNMGKLMTNLHEGSSKLIPCGAGVSLLGVDGDGDLHLCHRFVGSSHRSYGNVATGLDRNAIIDFVERSVTRSETFCGSCRARGLCAGGCYHESFERQGDPLQPTAHYCDMMREWIDFGVAVYAEIMARNPSFFGQRPRRD